MSGENFQHRGTVLTFVSSYLPGYRQGGPVRTIAGLVERLGGEFTFRIVTEDRDAHDLKAYSGVQVDSWNRVGNADVFYTSPKRRTVAAIARILKETPHDILYLNSFFHPVFTLRPYLAMRLGLAPLRPCVIAPRGELAAAPLRLKRWKKLPYVTFVRRLGWFQQVVWQASSEYEAADIRRVLARTALRVEVAPNLSRTSTGPHVELALPAPRNPNSPLRACFLSRIVPVKNLHFALRLMARVSVPVTFDIYGPVGDERYWRRCRQEMANLPDHVFVRYHGGLSHAKVHKVLSEHDLLLLPTLGENYGHVISEALAAGTPVLISDTTPWRRLAQAGVGWDLPLQEQDAFVRCIEHCSRIEWSAYGRWRAEIRKYACVALNDDSSIAANRRLFQLV